MGVIKRAVLSIFRQPVKSLILLATIAILGTLIAGAVSIKQGLAATQKAITDKMPITATIQLKDVKTDLSYLTAEDLVTLPFLSGEKLTQITSLPQVKSFELTKNAMISAPQLVYKALGMSEGGVPINIFSAENEAFLDYEQGNLTIVNGRWLTTGDENSPDNPIVIPDLLAQENKISVGSKLPLDYSMNEISTEKSQPMTASFTVIGTYAAADRYLIIGNGKFFPQDLLKIRAYTTQKTLNPIIDYTVKKNVELNKEKAMKYTYTIPTLSIWLKDRESADAFADKVNSIGIPKEYQFIISTKAYDTTMAPLKNLNWISDLIVAGAVAATIVILGFVVMLVLKNRKTEIGILFSLGEKKKRIAAQMVVEVLLIAVIGLTASVFAGGKLAEGISGNMMKNEVTNTLQTGTSGLNGLDVTALYDLSEGGEVKLSGDTIAWIYLVGLLTAGASAVLPVIYTLRLDPKKILIQGEGA